MMKLCGGIFPTEKEATKAASKWKVVARNPKAEKSQTTSYWLLIVSEVDDSKAEDAMKYFWGKNFPCYLLKKN